MRDSGRRRQGASRRDIIGRDEPPLPPGPAMPRSTAVHSCAITPCPPHAQYVRRVSVAEARPARTAASGGWFEEQPSVDELADERVHVGPDVSTGASVAAGHALGDRGSRARRMRRPRSRPHRRRARRSARRAGWPRTRRRPPRRRRCPGAGRSRLIAPPPDAAARARPRRRRVPGARRTRRRSPWWSGSGPGDARGGRRSRAARGPTTRDADASVGAARTRAHHSAERVPPSEIDLPQPVVALAAVPIESSGGRGEGDVGVEVGHERSISVRRSRRRIRPDDGDVVSRRRAPDRAALRMSSSGLRRHARHGASDARDLDRVRGRAQRRSNAGPGARRMPGKKRWRSMYPHASCR